MTEPRKRRTFYLPDKPCMNLLEYFKKEMLISTYSLFVEKAIIAYGFLQLKKAANYDPHLKEAYEFFGRNVGKVAPSNIIEQKFVFNDTLIWLLKDLGVFEDVEGQQHKFKISDKINRLCTVTQRGKE